MKDYSEMAFYKALVAKYKAEIAECLATLETYFEKPVGIGEHSDLLVEFDKFLDKMAAAEDKLETLKKHFGFRHKS